MRATNEIRSPFLVRHTWEDLSHEICSRQGGGSATHKFLQRPKMFSLQEDYKNRTLQSEHSGDNYLWNEANLSATFITTSQSQSLKVTIDISPVLSDFLTVHTFLQRQTSDISTLNFVFGSDGGEVSDRKVIFTLELDVDEPVAVSRVASRSLSQRSS